MKDPIKNFQLAPYPSGDITQFFGENPGLYRRFGLKAHTGLDIVAPHGEPIYAVEGGEVINVKYDPDGFGKHVRILSPIEGTTQYREWTYGHLSAIHVTIGSVIPAGKQIGLMGNTGFVVSGATPFWEYNPYAGTHLHLQARRAKLDPDGWSYPNSDVKIQIVDYDNGYKGCYDIAPHFNFPDFSDTPKGKQMLTIISLQKTLIGILKKLVALR